MTRKILCTLLAAILLFGVLPTPLFSFARGQGGEGVPDGLLGEEPEEPEALYYVDADGEIVTLEGATELDEDVTAWEDGFYVLTDDLTVEGPITVSGTVNLVLCAGATLTVNSAESDPGIYLPAGNTLNIFGQKADTGCLVANAGDMAAGIGGGDAYVGYVGDCGILRVYGGTVRANGGYAASGIGGGDSGRGGIVEVYGGFVYACGSEDFASGIGGTSDFSGSPVFSGSLAVHGGIIRASGESAARCGVTLDDGTIVYNMDRGVEDYAHALEEGACADALFGDLSYDLGGRAGYLPASFRIYNGETTLSEGVWLVTSDYTLSRPISAPQGATMVVADGCAVDLRAGRGRGLTIGYRSTGDRKGSVLGDYYYNANGNRYRLEGFTEYNGETTLSGGWYYVTESCDIPFLNAEGDLNFVVADGVDFSVSVFYLESGYTARGYTESYGENMGTADVRTVDFPGLVSGLSCIGADGSSQPLPTGTKPYNGESDLYEGWYLVYKSVTTGNVRVHGDVHIVVCDDYTLTATGSISVLRGDTLTLTATGTGEHMGSVAAAGVIGGNRAEMGTVNVYAGNIAARVLGTEYTSDSVTIYNTIHFGVNAGDTPRRESDGIAGSGSVRISGGVVTADKLQAGLGEIVIDGGRIDVGDFFIINDAFINGGELTADTIYGRTCVITDGTVKGTSIAPWDLRIGGGRVICDQLCYDELQCGVDLTVTGGTLEVDTLYVGKETNSGAMNISSATVNARRICNLFNGNWRVLFKDSKVTVQNEEGPAIDAEYRKGGRYAALTFENCEGYFAGTATSLADGLYVTGKGTVSLRLLPGATDESALNLYEWEEGDYNSMVDSSTKEFVTFEEAMTLPAIDIIYTPYYDGEQKNNLTEGKVYDGETVLTPGGLYYVNENFDVGERLVFGEGATLIFREGVTVECDYLFPPANGTMSFIYELPAPEATGGLLYGHAVQSYRPDRASGALAALPADTVIYNGQTALAANKWYYVPQDMTLDGRLYFGSGARLVIRDGVTLTVGSVVLNTLGTDAIHIHDPADPGRLVGTYVYPGIGENDLPIGLPEDTLIYNGETVLEGGKVYYAASDFDVGERLMIRAGTTLVLGDGVTVEADYLFLPLGSYSVYGVSSGENKGELLGTKVYPYLDAEGVLTALPDDAIIYTGQTGLEAGKVYCAAASVDAGDRIVFGEGTLLVLADGVTVEADTVCLPTVGRAAVRTVSAGAGKGTLSGLLLLPYIDGGVTRAVPTDAIVYNGQTVLAPDALYYVAQSADAGERLVVGEGTRIVLAEGVTLNADYIFLPRSGDLNVYQIKEGNGRSVLSGMLVTPYYDAEGGTHAVPGDALIYAGETTLLENAFYFVPRSVDAGARIDIPESTVLVLADGAILTAGHIFTGTAASPTVCTLSTGSGKGVLEGELVGPYVDENGEKLPLPIDTVIFNGQTALSSGFYLVDVNFTLSEPLVTSGDVKLVLADGKRLSVVGGIAVASGSILSVYAQSDAGNVGSIYAIGGIGSAGIGGRMSVNGGSVRICGGSVTAIGGTGASGIGAGAGGRTSVYIAPTLYVRAGSDEDHLVGVTAPGNATYVSVTPAGGEVNAYDVNGDGKVDISDVTALLNSLAGASPEGLRLFDYDGDRTITIGDVTMMLNRLSGVG